MRPWLSVEGIGRRYGERPVFRDVWFGVERGEFVALIGHSGCGKTTILNILAGLEAPDDGVIAMDGHAVSGPALDRAVIFQSHALLPWLTALGNVAFAVRSRHKDWSRAKVGDHARRVLDLVGLSDAAARKPAELSGGMKQRVGIARALAVEPALLLMDEPFSALDALTRGTLQDEVLRLVSDAGQTAFMITHDVDEAILLADRILLMTNGPDARVAEVVVNTLPRPRDRQTIHHTPGHHALRTHVVDFLVSRSRALAGTRPAGWGWAVRAGRASGGPDAGGGGLNDAKTALGLKITKLKKQKGWTWAEVAEKLGHATVWTAAACLGQMSMTAETAEKAGLLFGLDVDEVALLAEAPYRGSLPTAVPTDPLIYRFYELVSVYGTTWKELIHEEFGDGIMSAIDFDMTLDRQPDQKGDRVKIGMSGKFLPYKRY